MEESPISPPSRTRPATDTAEPDRPQKRARADLAPPRVSRACDRCKLLVFIGKVCSVLHWLTSRMLVLGERHDALGHGPYIRRGQLLPAIDNNAVILEGRDCPEGANSNSSEKARGGGNTSAAFHRTSYAETAPISISLIAVSGINYETSFSLQSPSHLQESEITDVPHDAVVVDDVPDLPDTDSLRNSPEPPQTDEQGHYVGPASGVSFLSRI
ncbi:finger protein [Colletotrichum salicis]|uniref:Finger protein n=1 Tax=Colletotrichum salicis TaxID=1209931 RepID=A0A135UGX2_9PEZI|nr:finger protein [Colletotrichum salicis]